ncbi:hypothetical protein B0T22DRAFT_474036 [Podospora appendiculata]|uniref:NAD(P)-binding domain-containing protein n=1 Tax=Podospora appendiculata TaxID=314037 RepID=A0AAE1C753_9PEZI|nr:hypothetical protein B0T22DRAFT_474036 [Podospora appendiculata]
MSTTTKTVLFLGATGGCGLSALRRSLAAGHTCIALCRTPSKLTDKLASSTPPTGATTNLVLEQGNAHDVDALARCLVQPRASSPHALVDTIVFSIGGAFDMSSFSLDDPAVCEKGITALLAALQRCRDAQSATGRPRLVVISSTGISDAGRDIPLLMVPLYHVMLKTPHKDKKALEKAVMGSAEEWTIVRPSFFTDGPESPKGVRVGVEDPVAGTVESKAVGYTISREDVGKWIFENVVEERPGDARWVKRAVSITS